MKYSLIRPRTALLAACGIMLAAGICTFRAKADAWNRKTTFTVDQPTQITDTVLEPGKYVLMLADSNSDRHIVEIFNGDQTHLINTVLAFPKYRMEPTGKTQFSFWETPPGTARALRAWYYPGDTIGQEFPYPRHPKQLAMVEKSAMIETQPATPPLSEPQTAVAPPPVTQEAAPQQEEKQPAEIAQNTAPPPEPAPAAPQTQPAEPPKELPKTGSVFPLIGLSGLFSLGLGGLLRGKRSA